MLLTWFANPSGIESPLELSPAQLNARPLLAAQANPPADAGGCASPKRRIAADRSTDWPEKDRKGIVTFSGQGKHAVPFPPYLRGARADMIGGTRFQKQEHTRAKAMQIEI